MVTYEESIHRAVEREGKGRERGRVGIEGRERRREGRGEGRERRRGVKRRRRGPFWEFPWQMSQPAPI